MPNDKLARFVSSGQFIKRANAAITEAVRDLEAHGIRPAYVVRRPEGESNDQVVAAEAHEVSAKRKKSFNAA